MDEPVTRGGQVTLTQMLKALDKDVAAGIEKKLKKLSKKKAIETPLDDHKKAQVERKAAYSEVSKDICKWDPIVERNRQAKQLKFPLDQQPDVLPSTTDSLAEMKPRNDLEREVQSVIEANQLKIRANKELTKAEEKYLRAINSEVAEERHRELQRMRVLLSSYAAKMKRRKAIKSKSYRRLLKHERVRKHMKNVESNKDMIMDEIEKLQKLRAQERASLKHKNTGKWAKQIKFRTKYDESARQAMLEQIGVAKKLLQKPAVPESDSDHGSESDEQDSDSDSDDSEIQAVMKATNERVKRSDDDLNEEGRLIVSSELIGDRSMKKRKASDGKGDDDDDEDQEDDGDDDDDDDEDQQRRLMSEAFANDDVVGEFKRAKDKIADEEQPKDVNLYLPGWGNWAGPGIKVNRLKKKKFLKKAEKIKRKDETMNNVIISERADDAMKDLQLKRLPRGVKSEAHLGRILAKPITASFVEQNQHRELIKPRVATKMGARIEPLNQRVLRDHSKATWAS